MVVAFSAFLALVVVLILNIPVGFGIGLSSVVAVLADGRLSSQYIVEQIISGTDSFPLMAIPLFILAGELMGAGGVSKRLCNFSYRIQIKATSNPYNSLNPLTWSESP